VLYDLETVDPDKDPKTKKNLMHQFSQDFAQALAKKLNHFGSKEMRILPCEISFSSVYDVTIREVFMEEMSSQSQKMSALQWLDTDLIQTITRSMVILMSTTNVPYLLQKRNLEKGVNNVYTVWKD
jgi:hypothetical protein